MPVPLGFEPVHTRATRGGYRYDLYDVGAADGLKLVHLKISRVLVGRIVVPLDALRLPNEYAGTTLAARVAQALEDRADEIHDADDVRHLVDDEFAAWVEWWDREIWESWRTTYEVPEGTPRL